MALAASHTGIWEWDLRTDAVSLSRECFDLLGVRWTEGTLRSAMDLLMPSDALRVLSAARAAIAEKSVFREEFRTIRPDGAVLWLSAIGQVEYDDAGAPLRLVGTAQDITETKALQIEINKREQWVDSFFMGATAGLALLDRDLRYIRINETLAEMNGLPAGEHIGRTVREVVPGMADAVEPIFRQVLATGRPVLNVEVSGETPRQPGVPRQWLESFFPMKGEDGVAQGVGAIVVEITELKSAELALDESRQFAQATIDALSASICVLDEAGTILAVNHAWRAFAEANPPVRQNVFEGANYLAVTDGAGGPDTADASAFAAGIRAVISGARSAFSREYPCHSPAEQRWFIGRVTRFPGPGPVRIVVAHENITTCKLAELALQESEERYRMLFENSMDAIMLTVPDGRILSANPAACLMFGRTEAELRAAGRDGLVDTGDSRMQSLIEERKRTGRASGELTFVRKDGSRFPGEISSQLFTDREGNTRTSMFIHDITKRKQAESEVLSYRDALRSLALELSLTEERERHRIATDLHDNIGQTLALASIKLGGLRECTDITGVTDGVDDIRGLVRQAIEYTRSVTFDLSPPVLYELGLVAGLSALAEQFQGRHAIEIEITDDEQPKVLGDDQLIALYKAVRELLMNIVKHAKARKAVITLQRNADSIGITVEDDGTGFEASAMKPYGSAGGFGLFSTRERLRGIGGRLEIASAPGTGTKVTIEAPLQQ
jgi:PAS domain S-box-containing protein